jgi:hypothetical protein
MKKVVVTADGTVDAFVGAETTMLTSADVSTAAAPAEYEETTTV